MERNWYAVYTKTNDEQKVIAALRKKGFEVYCPLKHTVINKPFGKKTVLKPLFPSLVFVNILEKDMQGILEVTDVISWMYWLGKPATFPDIEIRSIFKFVDMYENIRVEKSAVNRLENNSKLIAEKMFLNIKTSPEFVVKMSLPTLGFTLVANAQSDSSYKNVEKEKARIVF